MNICRLPLQKLFVSFAFLREGKQAVRKDDCSKLNSYQKKKKEKILKQSERGRDEGKKEEK